MKLKVELFFVLIFLLVSCNTEEFPKEIKIMEFDESSEYIAIFGDIQYLTNVADIFIYQYSCDWILAQKNAGMNINSVLHTGDVTQKNEIYSWKSFYNATYELAKEIPYISAIGDHDYTWDDAGVIHDRYSTHFNEYVTFPLTKQKIVAWYEKGRMENIVVENHIHGMPIFFLVLEFGPRKEVVDWANEYVKNHPDIRFILINHEYLEAGGGRRSNGLKCNLRLKDTNTTYTTPTQLWNQLIKNNNNILCVLCGHVGSLYAYTLEKNDYGREVPQIEHNIQSSAYRYDYWLMLWEFPVDNDSANVQIVNTGSLINYNNKPTLFKFRYKM